MKKLTKVIAILLSVSLLLQQVGFAQVAGTLDISGFMTQLRQSIAVDKFRPLHLRYLAYDNINNNFKLLLDKGDIKNLKSAQIEETSKKLLNLFFVGVTLPNDSFWVNLRPDSPDKMLDPMVAQTDVGKVFCEADLQLKKDTAKFTSPDTAEGKEYWNKLYQKAGEIFGSENITIPTLTRPWIVPDEIIIRESTDNAYIYKATLKVMLEQDYLAGSATYNFKDERLKALNEYSSQLIRELIIPKLTKEINTSKRYASLRQVYYSLIMAQWFKQKFYGKGGLYSWLIDKQKLNGLTSKENWSKDSYFKEYQKSFQQGEYNFKVPVFTPYGQTIRSYFSGGISVGTVMQQATIVPAPSPLAGSSGAIAELSLNQHISSPVNVAGGSVDDLADVKPEVTQAASAASSSAIQPQSTAGNAARLALETAHQESIKRLLRQLPTRPKPDDIISLSMEDIIHGSDATPAQIQQILDSQTMKVELGNILPYAEIIVKQLTRLLASGRYSKILICGRDADIFDDALQVVLSGTGLEGRVVRLPSSEKMRYYVRDAMPADDKIKFLSHLGITSNLNNENILVFDTGFEGSVYLWLSDLISKTFPGMDVPKHLSCGMIRSQLGESLQIIKLPPPSAADIAGGFPYNKFPKSAFLARSADMNTLVACAVDALPQYSGGFTKALVTDTGAVKFIADNAVVSFDPDRLERSFHSSAQYNNSGIVNPAAAMMVQKRVVDYFISHRDQLLSGIGSLNQHISRPVEVTGGSAASPAEITVAVQAAQPVAQPNTVNSMTPSEAGTTMAHIQKFADFILGLFKDRDLKQPIDYADIGSGADAEFEENMVPLLTALGFKIRERVSVDGGYFGPLTSKVKKADITDKQQRESIGLGDESRDLVTINNIQSFRLVQPAMATLKPGGVLLVTFAKSDLEDRHDDPRIIEQVIAEAKELLGYEVREIQKPDDYPVSNSKIKHNPNYPSYGKMLIITRKKSPGGEIVFSAAVNPTPAASSPVFANVDLPALRETLAAIRKSTEMASQGYATGLNDYILSTQLLADLGIARGDVLYPCMGVDLALARHTKVFGLNTTTGLTSRSELEPVIALFQRNGWSAADTKTAENNIHLITGDYRDSSQYAGLRAQGGVDVIMAKGLGWTVSESEIRKFFKDIGSELLKSGGYVVIVGAKDEWLRDYLMREFGYKDIFEQFLPQEAQQLPLDEYKQVKDALSAQNGGPEKVLSVRDAQFVVGRLPMAVLQKPVASSPAPDPEFQAAAETAYKQVAEEKQEPANQIYYSQLCEPFSKALNKILGDKGYQSWVVTVGQWGGISTHDFVIIKDKNGRFWLIDGTWQQFLKQDQLPLDHQKAVMILEITQQNGEVQEKDMEEKFANFGVPSFMSRRLASAIKNKIKEAVTQNAEPPTVISSPAPSASSPARASSPATSHWWKTITYTVLMAMPTLAVLYLLLRDVPGEEAATIAPPAQPAAQAQQEYPRHIRFLIEAAKNQDQMASIKLGELANKQDRLAFSALIDLVKAGNEDAFGVLSSLSESQNKEIKDLVWSELARLVLQDGLDRPIDFFDYNTNDPRRGWETMVAFAKAGNKTAISRVLAYANDRRDPEKGREARALVSKLIEQGDREVIASVFEEDVRNMRTRYLAGHDLKALQAELTEKSRDNALYLAFAFTARESSGALADEILVRLEKIAGSKGNMLGFIDSMNDRQLLKNFILSAANYNHLNTLVASDEALKNAVDMLFKGLNAQEAEMYSVRLALFVEDILRQNSRTDAFKKCLFTLYDDNGVSGLNKDLIAALLTVYADKFSAIDQQKITRIAAERGIQYNKARVNTAKLLKNGKLIIHTVFMDQDAQNFISGTSEFYKSQGYKSERRDGHIALTKGNVEIWLINNVGNAYDIREHIGKVSAFILRGHAGSEERLFKGQSQEYFMAFINACRSATFLGKLKAQYPNVDAIGVRGTGEGEPGTRVSYYLERALNSGIRDWSQIRDYLKNHIKGYAGNLAMPGDRALDVLGIVSRKAAQANNTASSPAPAPGIDKTALTEIFTRNHYLSYLVLNMSLVPWSISADSTTKLQQLRDEMNTEYLNFLAMPAGSTDEIRLAYLQLALLIRKNLPTAKSLVDSIPEGAIKKNMKEGIIDAERFANGIEMLMDDSNNQVNINNTLDAMSNIVFSKHYRDRGGKYNITMQAASDMPKLNANQGDIAYLFLNLFLPFVLPLGVFNGKEVELKVSTKSESGNLVITAESNQAPSTEDIMVYGHPINAGFRVAQRIAKKYGGTIEAQSQGTKLIVRLPIAQQAASSPAPWEPRLDKEKAIEDCRSISLALREIYADPQWSSQLRSEMRYVLTQSGALTALLGLRAIAELGQSFDIVYQVSLTPQLHTELENLLRKNGNSQIRIKTIKQSGAGRNYTQFIIINLEKARQVLLHPVFTVRERERATTDDGLCDFILALNNDISYNRRDMKLGLLFGVPEVEAVAYEKQGSGIHGRNIEISNPFEEFGASGNVWKALTHDPANKRYEAIYEEAYGIAREAIPSHQYLIDKPEGSLSGGISASSPAPGASSPNKAEGLLELDRRPIDGGLLNTVYVGHDMEVCRAVNPDHQGGQIAVNVASGAGISNYLLSLDATTGYFVDTVKVNAGDLTESLARWAGLSGIVNDPEFFGGYAQRKFRAGYEQAFAAFGDGSDGIMSALQAEKILYELQVMGVDKESIAVEKIDDKTVKLTFKWAYPGRPLRTYEIYFVHQDIASPESFPQILRDLKGKATFIYERAGLSLPARYHLFINELISYLKPNGYLMTDDVSYDKAASEPYVDQGKYFDNINNLVTVKTPAMGEWEQKIATYREDKFEKTSYGAIVRIRQVTQGSATKPGASSPAPAASSPVKTGAESANNDGRPFILDKGTGLFVPDRTVVSVTAPKDKKAIAEATSRVESAIGKIKKIRSVTDAQALDKKGELAASVEDLNYIALLGLNGELTQSLAEPLCIILNYSSSAELHRKVHLLLTHLPGSFIFTPTQSNALISSIDRFGSSDEKLTQRVIESVTLDLNILSEENFASYLRIISRLPRYHAEGLTNLPSEMTFGVEIEVNLLDAKEATDLLATTKLLRKLIDFASREGLAARGWVVKRDMNNIEITTKDKGLPNTREGWAELRDGLTKLWGFIMANSPERSLYYGMHVHIGSPLPSLQRGKLMRAVSYIGKSMEHCWSLLGKVQNKLVFSEDALWGDQITSKGKTPFYDDATKNTVAINTFAPAPINLLSGNGDKYFARLQLTIGAALAIVHNASARPGEFTFLRTGLPLLQSSLYTKENSFLLRRHINHLFGGDSAGTIAMLQLLYDMKRLPQLPVGGVDVVNEQRIKKAYEAAGFGELYALHKQSNGWSSMAVQLIDKSIQQWRGKILSPNTDITQQGQGVEVLGDAASNGSHSAAMALKEIILTTENTNLQSMAMHALKSALFKDSQPAATALKEIILTAENTNVQGDALEALASGCFADKEFAVRSVEELIIRVKEIILTKNDTRLQNFAIDALQGAANRNSQPAATALKEIVFATEDIGLQDKAIAALEDASIWNSLPAVTALKEISLTKNNTRLQTGAIAALISTASLSSYAATALKEIIPVVPDSKEIILTTQGFNPRNVLVASSPAASDAAPSPQPAIDIPRETSYIAEQMGAKRGDRVLIMGYRFLHLPTALGMHGVNTTLVDLNPDVINMERLFAAPLRSKDGQVAPAFINKYAEDINTQDAPLDSFDIVSLLDLFIDTQGDPQATIKMALQRVKDGGVVYLPEYISWREGQFGLSAVKKGTEGLALNRLCAELGYSYEQIPGKFIPGDQTNLAYRITKHKAQPTVSSPAENAKGGIDLSALPIVVQPMPNNRIPAPMVPNLSAATDKDLLEIQNMLVSGITPSGERLKDYMAKCSDQQDMNKILSCLADIFRMEEDQAVATDPALRQFLVLLESGKNSQELKQELNKISFAPQEPELVE